MSITVAAKYHEGILEQEEKFTEEDMANSQINPPYRAVQYWYEQWRLQNLGPRTGQGLIEVSCDKSVFFFNMNPPTPFFIFTYKVLKLSVIDIAIYILLIITS